MNELTVAQLATLLWPVMAAFVGAVASTTVAGALARSTALYLIGEQFVPASTTDFVQPLPLKELGIEVFKVSQVWSSAILCMWLLPWSMDRR